MTANTINRITYIYGLYDSLDLNKTIRYVGKTRFLKRRIGEHRKGSAKKSPNSYRKNWINSVIKNEGEIYYVILEECNDRNWSEREKYWIKFYKKTNKLTNITPGGEDGSYYDISYEDCKKWVSENASQIKSHNLWRKYSKKLPNHIPKDPYQVFIENGWISWGDFLGTNKVCDNNIIEQYVSYNEAKKWIKENLNIKTHDEWKINVRNKKIPVFIPNRPDRFYNTNNRNWISWGDFLGTGKISDNDLHDLFLNYEDCKNWVKENCPDIKTFTQWKYFIKNNQIPIFIPNNPQITYKRSHEWIGWENFLESKNLTKKEKEELNRNYKTQSTEDFLRLCPKCSSEIVHKSKEARNNSEKNKYLCRKCINSKNKERNRIKMKEKFLIFDEVRNNQIIEVFEKEGNNWDKFRIEANKLFYKFKKETKVIITEFYRKCPDCNNTIVHKDKRGRDKAITNDCLCRKCQVKGERNPFYGKTHTKESALKIASTKEKTRNAKLKIN